MIQLIDRWDDFEGNEYLTLGFNGNERTDWKRLNDEERFIYVMQCQNGKEVYHSDSTDGVRDLTDEEFAELYDFVKEQFEVEAELNESFEEDV